MDQVHLSEWTFDRKRIKLEPQPALKTIEFKVKNSCKNLEEAKLFFIEG